MPDPAHSSPLPQDTADACDVAHRLLTEHIGKGYRVIYADPPWRYRNKSPTASARPHGFSSGEQYYYPTLSLQQIQSLPVAHCAAPDAACFLWATVPLLPEAIDTLRKWGFSYKTTLTWHKVNSKGMGYWFRGCTEHLLFGVRGTLTAFRSRQKNFVETKVGKHSEKPEIFADLIDEVLPGPKLELFARHRRESWAVWGAEVGARSDARSTSTAIRVPLRKQPAASKRR